MRALVRSETGRVEHRDGPALVSPEQDRIVCAGGVGDGDDVADPDLRRGDFGPGVVVGKADTPLVETDHPGEGCESVETPCDGRNIPTGLEWGGPLVDEDEIERSIADNLVGKVEPVDLGIADWRRRGHGYAE